MIPQIKKILYATDLSVNSAYVFRHAINSAKKNDAGIIILHVLEPISETTKMLLDSLLDKVELKRMHEEKISSVKDRIRDQLEAFCRKELKDDPQSADRVEAIELCEGFPAEEILRKADEFNCDTIVMGTHGKGLMSYTFLGSTSKKVLRRTRKPVLIIPMPKKEIDTSLDDL